MASSVAKQLAVQNAKLIEELISSVTSLKKERDQQKFKKSLKYVNSVFSKNPFCDVYPLDVWKRVQSITERFENCAQYQKLKYWLLLTSTFRNKAEATNNEQSLCAVLFVLMQLANLRTPFPSDCTAFDRILKVSEGSLPSVFQSENESEDSRILYKSESETESESGSDEPDVQLDISSISADSGAGNSPDIELGPPFLPQDDSKNRHFEVEYDISLCGLLPRDVIAPYWFPRNYSKEITEQAIMTEIIWILQGNKDAFMFEWKGNSFCLKEGTSLVDVPQDTLVSSCSQICKCATYFVSLREFLGTFTRTNKPRILTAFALAVKEAIKPMTTRLLDLEKQITDEENPLTLLVILDELNPTLSLITRLWDLVQTGVYMWSSLTPSNCTLLLLQILYKEVVDEDSTVKHHSMHLPVLVNIFLETIRPYLVFIDQLLSKGEIDDPYSEFIIHRFEPETNQKCDKVLVFRQVSENVQENFFLYKVLKDVICVSNLTVVLKETRNWEAPSDGSSGLLSDEFIHQCKTKLDISHNGSEKPLCKPNPPQKNHINLSNYFFKCDPLLRINFKKIMPGFETYNEFQPEETLVSEPLVIPEHVSWRLLSHLLESTLSSLVTAKSVFIHRKVMLVLKDDLCIQDHLLNIKKFFLLQEGRNISTFTKQIVRKMTKGKPWTSSVYINLLFKDCVTESNIPHPELLSMSVDTDRLLPNKTKLLDELDMLSLNYAAPSPVNLILNTESMTIYQNIFCFLMKLNCAKTSLDMLRFNDLTGDKRFDSSASPETMFMCMWKMRLLHLVNTFHYCFLTGLLQTRLICFDSAMNNASSFDQILCLHQEHLKKLEQFYLLTPSCTLLNSILCDILNLVLTFSRNWCPQTLLTGMKDMILLEKVFHHHVQAFGRALSVFLCPQGRTFGFNHVQLSDFLNLSNIVWSYKDVPRLQL